MTDAEIRAALVDRSVLALTMWAEARGDGREGNSSVEERIAVGCVVRNRLAEPGRFRADAPTYRAVCLAPSQFSCWLKVGGSANYAALMALAERVAGGLSSDDAAFAESLYLADGIMARVLLDRTGGATAYYAPAAMTPRGRVPQWATGKATLAVGSQLFLRL